MKKGDIVLIPFPFTDLLGNKNRLAIILINSDVDVTVCFVTTQMKWLSEFDLAIDPSNQNGLKKISLVRLNKIATIEKDLVIGRLGSLNEAQLTLLDSKLIAVFKIQIDE